MPTIDIINGDHAVGPDGANWPFMVVDRCGLHVDLSTVRGELWDPTVAMVTWGHMHINGKLFGTVRLKNGQGRVFWDVNLMRPYLAAYAIRKAEEDAKHAANMKARADEAVAAAALSAKRDHLAALARRLAANKPEPATLTGPLTA